MMATVPHVTSGSGLRKFQADEFLLDSVRINLTLRRVRNCCRRKAIRIAYSECMFVALVIQHAMRMHRYYTTICGLSGSTIFFHAISLTARFWGGKVIQHKLR